MLTVPYGQNERLGQIHEAQERNTKPLKDMPSLTMPCSLIVLIVRHRALYHGITIPSTKGALHQTVLPRTVLSKSFSSNGETLSRIRLSKTRSLCVASLLAIRIAPAEHSTWEPLAVVALATGEIVGIPSANYKASASRL